MALSKSSRIWLLLGINVIFFLLELIVGSAVHSLALVADSFHMLNDVLSLCVGLWAVKVANQSSSKMYTYGWQRAETLGALINGVFLVALCVTIVLEAIQRFVDPPIVSRPQLVFAVGSFGLAFNIVGLFLFHQHSHDSGEKSEHTHTKDDIKAIEEGQSTYIDAPGVDGPTAAVADQGGKVADVLPQTAIGAWSQESPSHNATLQFSTPKSSSFGRHMEGSPAASTPISRKLSGGSRRQRVKGSSRSRRATSINEYTHPAEFRQSVIAAGRLDYQHSGSSSESDEDMHHTDEIAAADESQPLLHGAKTSDDLRDRDREEDRQDSWHAGHKHKTNRRGSRGNSHGDLNIRGIFLHVMGDALGNIGVISSALFIWLTDFKWRFYVDPAISLHITIIILTSAIPLCKAASRILLQAVPTGINVDDIQDDIETFEGVISCHHVHVWGLDDTKMVASLHVQLDCDLREGGSAGYMELARKIRGCLHGFGIHSSTIQPEFMPREGNQARRGAPKPDAGGTSRPNKSSRQASSSGSVRSGARECLLECEEGCGDDSQCCIPSNHVSDDEGHTH